MKRIPPHINTFAEVGSDEIEVRCEFDYQPSEFDTNTPEGLEVTAAYRYTDGQFDDVLARMTPEEIEYLTDCVMEKLRGHIEYQRCSA